LRRGLFIAGHFPVGGADDGVPLFG
jgi:hypothetical protein